MANPLSEQGWTDKDYAGLVGTLVGEAAARGTVVDHQAIADVVANRLADPAYTGQLGTSVAAQVMNPKQFSAWSPREKAANFNARMGFAAALNPQRATALSPALQKTVELAKQAVSDVFVSGKARGITQGATAYHNPDVTAKLGTGGWHNRLESKYGGLTIGDHRFTGQGFDPNRTFDPVTYNGQLGMPEVAEADFTGVPFNENRYDDYSSQIDPVTTGSIDYGPPVEDLSAPYFGGYDIPAEAGFSLPEAAPVDFSESPFGDFSDITNGTAFDPRDSFSPASPAMPDFSDAPYVSEQDAIDRIGLSNQRLSENISINLAHPEGWEDAVDGYITDNFDTTRQRYGTPGAPPLDTSGITSISPISDHSYITDGIFDFDSFPDGLAGDYTRPGVVSFDAEFNPATPSFSDLAAPPSGFSQGFESNIPTPDFSAPSTVERAKSQRSFDINQANVDDFNQRNYARPDEITANIAKELGQPTGWGQEISDQIGTNRLTGTAAVDDIPDLSELPSSTPALASSGLGTPMQSRPAPQQAQQAPQQPARAASIGRPAGRPETRSADPYADLEDRAPISPQAQAAMNKDPMGFMDAMANPLRAASYNPMDAQLGPSFMQRASTGWSTPGLIGAGLGLVTGGIPSAFSGYSLGKTLGGLFDDNYGQSYDQMERGKVGSLSSFGTAYDDLGIAMPHDAYMATPGLAQSFFDQNMSFLDRIGSFYNQDATVPRSERGDTGFSGGRVGDGSFSSNSGYNDNNPQGIL